MTENENLFLNHFTDLVSVPTLGSYFVKYTLRMAMLNALSQWNSWPYFNGVRALKRVSRPTLSPFQMKASKQAQRRHNRLPKEIKGN